MSIQPGFDVVIPCKPVYVGGTGPALAPITVLPPHDEQSWRIEDTIEMDGKSQYVVTPRDNSLYRKAVSKIDILQFVSHRTLENFEYEKFVEWEQRELEKENRQIALAEKARQKRLAVKALQKANSRSATPQGGVKKRGRPRKHGIQRSTLPIDSKEGLMKEEPLDLLLQERGHVPVDAEFTTRKHSTLELDQHTRRQETEKSSIFIINPTGLSDATDDERDSDSDSEDPLLGMEYSLTQLSGKLPPTRLSGLSQVVSISRAANTTSPQSLLKQPILPSQNHVPTATIRSAYDMTIAGSERHLENSSVIIPSSRTSLLEHQLGTSNDTKKRRVTTPILPPPRIFQAAERNIATGGATPNVDRSNDRPILPPQRPSSLPAAALSLTVSRTILPPSLTSNSNMKTKLWTQQTMEGQYGPAIRKTLSPLPVMRKFEAQKLAHKNGQGSEKRQSTITDISAASIKWRQEKRDSAPVMEPQWEMKGILDHDFKDLNGRKVLFYLIDWEGDWQPTWEPANNVSSESIGEYTRRKGFMIENHEDDDIPNEGERLAK